MIKWKLVVFSTDSDDHKYPTTYTTPEQTIDSYFDTVKEIVGDPDNAGIVWADLTRIGARYAEWSYATLVLVSYED